MRPVTLSSYRLRACCAARGASLALALTFAAGSGGAQERTAAASGEVERVVVAMGTSLQLRVSASDRATALRASEAAVRTIERTEQRLSTWRRDSELSRWHASPIGSGFAASAALCEDLRRADRWRVETAGAFDPAIGALVDAYDLRGAGRWPTPAALVDARRRCGMSHVTIATRSLRRDAAVRLDAGAFGKGAALDAGAAAALAAGAETALLDFGGQQLLAGAAASRSLDVADPRDRARPALRLRIDGGSAATTGNSERGRRRDGRLLGHVIDPRTGALAEDFGSVTVLAARAFDADCLSTACFVLGPAGAVALAEQLEGVEALALVVDGDTGALSVRFSSGLRGRVTPLSPGLQLP